LKPADNTKTTGKYQAARIVLLVLACACAVAAALLATLTGAEKSRVESVSGDVVRSGTGSHVLLVMSYDDSDVLTPLARKGVLDVLGDNGTAVDVAYIDSLARPRGSESYVTWVKDMAERATADGPYNAVICADDEALTFFEDHHADIYADTPAVFFNVNDIDHAAAVANEGYATGIVEQSDAAAAVELARQLCPDATRILAVVDGTPSGVGDRAQFEAAVSNIEGLEVEYLDLSETSYDTLSRRVANAGDDTVVFVLDASKDVSGKTLSRTDAARFVAEASVRPVFGISSGGVGNGFAGETFTDPEESGRRAAQMCLDIIGGSEVNSMALVNEATGSFAVDALVLQRFGLSADNLPQNAVLINREPSLLDNLRASILPIGLVGAALVLLIVSTLLGFKRSETATRATVAKENDLTHRIYSDPLTGLPNMQWLDVFARESGEARKVESLVKIDIADFRSVNELHGRAAGDKVISVLAERLDNADNQFVVHCGGGQFVVAYGRDLKWDSRELEAIEDLLAEPVALDDGDEVVVDAHIGVANRASVLSLQDMADGADYAVREAKLSKAGRETVFFDAATKASIDAKKGILALLKRTIKGESFAVLYEPQVELSSNEVVGYQAAVRLKSNAYPPEQFVPVAEQSGLVIEINRIVAKKAVQQLATWKRRHKRLAPVMLPFAPVQLGDEDYVAFLADLLEKHEIPASFVAVELTDNLIGCDDEKVRELITRLNEAGIPMVFIGFGSSAESLSHLAAAPVGLVKLDGSFAESCVEPEGEQLLTSLVELLHGAGKTVAIGGVESVEQLNACEMARCDIVQGAYFSKPELPEKAAQYKPSAR